MAKEQFCIDMENVGELKDMKRIIDEQLAKFESASIEKDMKKIRDSIGYEAANKLFDAIQDCDMIDCTKDEFTKDFDGDVKAALKDSFPDVFDAIPHGAKIYDSVARLVGVMDANWISAEEEKIKLHKDPEGLMYRINPVENDPTEIPGWTEAQNKFNACEDDCIFGWEFTPTDGILYRYGFAKIDDFVFRFVSHNGQITLLSKTIEVNNRNQYIYPTEIKEYNENHPMLEMKVFFETPIHPTFKNALLTKINKQPWMEMYKLRKEREQYPEKYPLKNDSVQDGYTEGDADNVPTVEITPYGNPAKTPDEKANAVEIFKRNNGKVLTVIVNGTPRNNSIYYNYNGTIYYLQTNTNTNKPWAKATTTASEADLQHSLLDKWDMLKNDKIVYQIGTPNTEFVNALEFTIGVEKRLVSNQTAHGYDSYANDALFGRKEKKQSDFGQVKQEAVDALNGTGKNDAIIYSIGTKPNNQYDDQIIEAYAKIDGKIYYLETSVQNGFEKALPSSESDMTFAKSDKVSGGFYSIVLAQSSFSGYEEVMARVRKMVADINK